MVAKGDGRRWGGLADGESESEKRRYRERERERGERENEFCKYVLVF